MKRVLLGVREARCREERIDPSSLPRHPPASPGEPTTASYMVGMLDQVGTVEEGKIADLIVLAGNPLDHISNIRKLKMVFKNGLPVNLARDEGQTSFWELYFR